MKIKRKNKKELNFSKANEKLVFEIIRCVLDMKSKMPFLKIKISSS